MNNIAIEDFITAIKDPEYESVKTSYNAIVSKVDDEGVVWVRVAGSNKETPAVVSSADVNSGDKVSIEWRNNKLYVTGNYSDPSAGTGQVNNLDDELKRVKLATDNALQKARENAEAMARTIIEINSDIDNLQDQVDGNITTWFYNYVPTLLNMPASEWINEGSEDTHLGDLFYNTLTGYAYRWMSNGDDPPTYSWLRITDTDVTKALADAAKAQDTADSKRRVFYTTPVPPYDTGDLWVQGSNGDILRCATPKAEEESYSVSDWILASKYTDDTRADAAYDLADQAKESADGKNMIYRQASQPTGGTYASGDIWFDTSNDNKIYRYNGTTWVGFTLGDDALDSLSANKLTAGTIDASIITVSNLDAGNITTGKLHGDRIEASELYIGDMVNDAGYITESEAGSWYTGTGITGASATATIFPNSGVSEASVGDMYLNTSTSNTYRCTLAGAPSVAKWVYVSNIKGQDGQDGQDGRDGTDGTDGNGISSITLVSTSGNTKTYRITYTNGGHYDFSVNDGQDTSSQYMSFDSTNGLRVYSGDKSSSAYNVSYTQIKSNGIDLVSNSTPLAHFGYDTGIQIGQTENGNSRVVITADGMKLITRSTTGNDYEVVDLGYGTTIGGDNSKTPFYTLGIRKSGSNKGSRSVAEGYHTEASEVASHAEGYRSVASGKYSHAEGGGALTGYESVASGTASHAEGRSTAASGDYSHAQNYHTTAGYDYQTAVGKWNNNQSNSLFEVGDGTSSTPRNAFVVDTSGNAKARTALFANGAEFSKQTGNHIVVGGIHICWGQKTITHSGSGYTESTVTLPYTYTSAPNCVASYSNRPTSGAARTAYATQGSLAGNKIYVGSYATGAVTAYVNWMTIGV